MNYFEWSKEYEKTARELDTVIERLKKQKKGKREGEKKELSDKIALYQSYRNECVQISNHLMQRHLGVA